VHYRPNAAGDECRLYLERVEEIGYRTIVSGAITMPRDHDPVAGEIRRRDLPDSRQAMALAGQHHPRF
jgi:hypothetical protein